MAGAIRRAVAEGECGPGDRLPPARDLAQALGVNVNTVLLGLRTLRDVRPRGGREFAVSVDDAEPGAALLNSLARHSR